MLHELRLWDIEGEWLGVAPLDRTISQLNPTTPPKTTSNTSPVVALHQYKLIKIKLEVLFFQACARTREFFTNNKRDTELLNISPSGPSSPGAHDHVALRRGSDTVPVVIVSSTHRQHLPHHHPDFRFIHHEEQEEGMSILCGRSQHPPPPCQPEHRPASRRTLSANILAIPRAATSKGTTVKARTNGNDSEIASSTAADVDVEEGCRLWDCARSRPAKRGTTP
ncbi:hypothetical protein BD410DRAFT_805622 [Rickenella mellea]|uniref:Uncharacterized protein n=1 Tax=Rickenella mellea TaxID=50990 RepID=A0A4Y7PVZ2_9AGAM|nr:hypothetical protein BD410DRAFT_805622 [Rickenella mellea]